MPRGAAKRRPALKGADSTGIASEQQPGAPKSIEYRVTPRGADDVMRVLSDVWLDEPFDFDADLIVMAYEGNEPIGMMVGRTVEVETFARAALAEHVLVREAWRDRGVGLELARFWAALCLDRGLRTLVCGIPKDRDREEITRLAQEFGFRPYHDTEDRTWYVLHLSPESLRESPAAAPPAAAAGG